MKTNIKLSSKMHLFIIISCIIMVVAAALGTIGHFTTLGFFNYGDDWADYRSITVSYSIMEFSSKDEVVKICDEAFKEAGISSYSDTVSNQNLGSDLIYKFTFATEETKIDKAVQLIQNKIDTTAKSDGGIIQSSVYSGVAKGQLGSALALKMCAVVVSVIIVFHFLYFVIRYRLSMAFAALLADVHNLLLYIALLVITRIPVGTAMFVFAALTLVVTVICTTLMFDRVRVNVKDEELSKLPAFELIDKTANENMLSSILIPAFLSGFALLLFILTAISSMSALAVLSPLFSALIGFIACAYGTAMFIPSVYSRFYLMAENSKAKRAQAKKEKAKSSK